MVSWEQRLARVRGVQPRFRPRGRCARALRAGSGSRFVYPRCAGRGGVVRGMGEGWGSGAGSDGWSYHFPVLGMEAQGSALGRASPACRSSMLISSGERTKAMRPSRGGRLMVTPASMSFWQVS